MTGRPPFRAVLLSAGLASLLAGLSGIAAAQTYVPPPPPLTTLPPCPADKKLAKKAIKNNQCDPTNVPGNAAPAPPVNTTGPEPASQRFPFPGETSAAPKPAAQAFPYPGDAAPAAKQPDSGFAGTYPARPGDPPPASGQKPADTPAANKFPYPGDPAPAGTASPSSSPSGAAPDSSTSSSSSSSSSDGSGGSSDPGAAGADHAADDQPKAADQPARGRRSLKVPKPQTDTERVDEDLNIAHFYLQSGNMMGAYLRSQDAVKLQPDYALAHFWLAEAARKLGKNAEAVQEYQRYLKLEPDGKQSKAAEKALAELN